MLLDHQRKQRSDLMLRQSALLQDFLPLIHIVSTARHKTPHNEGTFCVIEVKKVESEKEVCAGRVLRLGGRLVEGVIDLGGCSRRAHEA
jgi:hypothetical protein